MALRDDDPLAGMEAQVLREDPDLAQALASGRFQQESRRCEHRTWLAIGLAAAVVLAAGVVLEQTALLVLGLVLAGLAGYLLGPS